MPRAKHEQSDDGWTRVAGKSKVTPVKGPGLLPLAKDATLAKLLADFEKKMSIWKRSSSRKAVFNMLNRERPDEGWSFIKAVCLASGSFSRDNFENAKRTMSQFVTFIDIAQRVAEDCTNSIQLLAQDPSYTDLDKEFLAQFEIEVLELSFGEVVLKMDLYPAQSHLGPQTMLFEYFMDARPDHLRAIFEADLQFYMGSSLQSWISGRKSDPVIVGNAFMMRSTSADDASNTVIDKLSSNLAEEHLKHRRVLHFPRFEEDPLVFEGLSFHWKDVDDDDDD